MSELAIRDYTFTTRGVTRLDAHHGNARLVKPAMRAYPPSLLLNSPKNDRPECIEAVE